MFSQNDEEAVIKKFFGEAKGRFLDLGAYDGRSLSNTHALALRGWSGVAVEASPLAHLALRETYKGRSDIECVCAAVTADLDGSIMLWESADALSTTVSANYEVWKKSAKFNEVRVPAVSLKTFLEAHPGPYDFVSVDTEGTSAELALLMPWAELGTRLVCVEHDGRYGDLTRTLGAIGFSVLSYNGENVLLGRL